MSLRRIIAGTLLLAFAMPAAAQDDLQARLATAKHRVQLLEDQDAIENLQATYGYYFDKGLWTQAASLFTRTGSFEYGQRGVYIGNVRIAKAMLLFGPEGLARGYLNVHMMLQPYIVVADDGRTATARWQGMIQLAQPNASGVWGVGITTSDYVKEGGVWKIARLQFWVTALTDYDQGFTKSLIPIDGPSALFPPDKPPTVAYRSLPGNYVPPFAFNHPVTGKPLGDIPQPSDSVLGREGKK